MDRDSAIASWVDGNPVTLNHPSGEDDLFHEMLEQERIHSALAAYYDSSQASSKVTASVMAEILASSHEAARKGIWSNLARSRKGKRSRERWRMVWLGAFAAGAACLLLILANHEPPASDPVGPTTLVDTPAPPAIPESVLPEPPSGTTIVDSRPSPSYPKSPEPLELVPVPLESAPLPTPQALVAMTPSPVPEPTTSPAQVVADSPPLLATADIKPLTARDTNLRPFSDRSPWNLPLPANTKLTGSKLATGERNPRIFLRYQPVFFSKIRMPERELWVGGSKVGSLRMPAGVNLQMFRESPLLLVSPDGLTAWEVIRPRPAGEGRIEAERATLVDLAGDSPDSPPLIAGIIRLGELENGIPHALSIGLPASLTKTKFPLGSRIAIPKNLDPGKFGAAREVARALRDYGGIVTFASKSGSIEILSASGASPAIQSSLQEIAGHLRRAVTPAE